MSSRAEPSGVDLRMLASASVVDPAGRRVGRIHDIYLADRTGEVVAVSVALGRLGTRDVMVPIELLTTTGARRVTVDLALEEVRRAPDAPATGHVGPEELVRLRAATT